MPIGRVTGREIRKNRDGEKDVLLLTVEVSEPDDTQTVELITQAGEKYNPLNDSTVIISDLGEAWKVAIACDDGVEPIEDVEPGERQLYAIDTIIEPPFLVKVAIITLRRHEIIELNINEHEDFAVRYNELEAAFNEFKGAFNSFINSKYNTHTHLYQAGLGPPPPPVASAPTLQTGSPTIADISHAKIDNIKVSGKGEGG